MNPLSSFAMLITTGQILASAVTTRDNLHLRPVVSTKAVAGRLVTGLILLRAYLRRLIILIALKLEWSLVDKRGVMKRPHGRKMTPTSAKLSLTCLDSVQVSPWLNSDGPKFKKGHAPTFDQPVPVNMSGLYAQLDFLSAIAANPLAKAERLAFHLARRREGIIVAPLGPKRVAGRWGTQVRATYDALSDFILIESRSRPPPLPPPRTHWPMITAL
jgi:hypothetical protein